jgi:hypothetical protein
MALIRCPIHKIPYNEDNPRGCPVCAQEKDARGQPSLMQELARVSKSGRRPSGTTKAAPPVKQPEKRRTTESAWPVTPPPRKPEIEESVLGRAFRAAREHRNISVGAGAILVFSIGLITTSGPRYVEQIHPAPFTGTPRPLPIEANASVRTVFSMLGTQLPSVNPDAPQLARYSYGADFSVDALNGIVYAITFSVTNRSWHGLRVGVPQLTAEGALARLGRPTEPAAPYLPDAQVIEDYRVYPSIEARPRRGLVAEVRPPNGCYDVIVDLQPRAHGVLIDEDRRWAVVGRPDDPFEWVSTRVRVVSRSLSGPYADGIAC